MRKGFVLSLSILLLGSIASAEEREPEALFSGPITHGGFGGPFVAYSQLNGQDAVVVGGRGGWLINHSLVIGGGGCGVANDISVPEEMQLGSDHRLTLGYGGFWTEYILFPGELIHASVGALIGGGGVAYAREHGETMSSVASDSIFVFEPSVAVELNVARVVRLTVFADYRVVADLELPGLDASDVNGFVAGAMLKFGSF